jgi:Tfp pilus assembly protein FimT
MRSAWRWNPRQSQQEAGLTLSEALVVLAVLGLLAALSLPSGVEALARQRLEAATRRLGQGLEQARAQAAQRRSPCVLSLGAEGWRAGVAADLPSCSDVDPGLQDSGLAADLRVAHNFPAALRFSSNGLVLDGGTVVLSTAGTALRRCLVLAPPLGVVRLGRYQADPAAGLNSAACLPDPLL